MVRRTVRHGALAGSDFWGCTAYPVCMGTRPGDYVIRKLSASISTR